MRRHRFHLPELSPGVHVVSGQEAHHLTQVLRVKPGTPVKAFDGRGFEAHGTILEADQGRAVVELEVAVRSDAEPDVSVTVAVSLLKGDKLSEVVRRCTELGAVGFQPLLSSRSEVPALSANKLDRLRRVAREAAKQSGRALVPLVDEPLKLEEFRWPGTALVAHPHATGSLGTIRLEDERVTLISGPEGGFQELEFERLVQAGAIPVRLGSRILRAETAPVALLAALLIPEGL